MTKGKTKFCCLKLISSCLQFTREREREREKWCEMVWIVNNKIIDFWSSIVSHFFLKILIHYELIISARQKWSNKKINDYSCIEEDEEKEKEEKRTRREKNRTIFKATSFRNTQKGLRTQRKSQTSFKAATYSLQNSLFSWLSEWKRDRARASERERDGN